MKLKLLASLVIIFIALMLTKDNLKSCFRSKFSKQIGQGTTKITLLEKPKNNDRQQNNTHQKTKGAGSFVETFSKDFILEETGSILESQNDNWWVNSGAFLYSEHGIGRTIFGALDKNNKWRLDYKNYNADETDNGYHPQNIFRLITKSKWKNFTQSAYFRMKKYHLSSSKHRFESNGILLFNRYLDGNNLYYTGLRVDGAAVIKKKYKGKYYLMGYKKILKGKYDRQKNPNLIPTNQWIGIKSKVATISNNKTEIKLAIDIKGNGNWQEILRVIDDGKKFGGPTISQNGHAGIRTDFMDVQFDNYKIEERR